MHVADHYLIGATIFDFKIIYYDRAQGTTVVEVRPQDSTQSAKTRTAPLISSSKTESSQDREKRHPLRVSVRVLSDQHSSGSYSEY